MFSGTNAGEGRKGNTARYTVVDGQCSAEKRDKAEGTSRVQGWVTALASLS